MVFVDILAIWMEGYKVPRDGWTNYYFQQEGLGLDGIHPPVATNYAPVSFVTIRFVNATLIIR